MVVASALSAALALPLSATAATAAAPTTAGPGSVAAAVDGSGVVINEAYLNGGSANAPFTTKFVELYNPTAADVALDGWSVQYRSATGTGASNGTVALSGTIEAGGFYLVAGGSNGSNGAALPEPDVSGGLNFQGQNGTIALVAAPSAVTLPTGDVAGADERVVDLLGYGSSNTFESAAAPAGRANNAGGSLNRTGFADTDDNSADFAVLDTVTPTSSGGDPDPDPEPERARSSRSPRSRARAPRARSWGAPSRRAASSRRPTRRAATTASTSRRRARAATSARSTTRPTRSSCTPAPRPSRSRRATTSRSPARSASTSR
ncbi:hypothetical protein BJF88_02340 [Cellulosimicrobium sp. CUA-896]|nr:hypothetical protein BJF88_02340 [Cellulosimicrobium sp. CUA-896]